MMVLSDPAKSAKSALASAWIDGYDSQNNIKNITITKVKSLLFFLAVYHSKKHVIPHPGIAAILDVNNNMPVKFSRIQPKTIRKQ